MRRIAACALISTFLVAAVPAGAQLATVGNELSLSGRDGSRQLQPASGLRKDGSLVVWGDTVLGVIGRFYDVNGAPRAVPQRVVAANDPAPPVPFDAMLVEQRQPSLAVNADGSFLVAWQEVIVRRRADTFIDQKTDLSSRVLARIFRADGTPAGNPFEVGKGTGALGLVAAGRPAVVPTSDGYWVAWEEAGGNGDGIHVRRISKKGKPAKPTVIAVGGRRPALATGGNGLLLVWEAPAGSHHEVFGRLYKSSGKAQGPVFAVSTAPTRSAGHPAVAGRPGGDFLVAWEGAPLSAATNVKVFARLVAKTGAFPGGERALTPPTGGSSPRVALFAGGSWGAAWVSRNAPSGSGVDARTLDVAGTPGAVVHLSQKAPGGDDLSLNGGSDGRVLATWVGYDAFGRVSIRARLATVPH